ncbi:MAG: hypothetical protein JNJ41_02030 [Bacteroidia bacterium]|nr:hypothetical protein [Bacteroidia bacterium]
MKHLLLLVLVFSTNLIIAQSTIKIQGKNCPMEGDAQMEDEIKQNPFKNRYTFPKKSDVDETIDINYLLKAKGSDAKLSQDMAVKITGYVRLVKAGSKETCNCHASKVAFQDTHIEITPTKKSKGIKNILIIEVTPRIRKLLLEDGEDWSTSELKDNIEGKMITFTGWLFYDGSHEDEAYANDTKNKIGKKNWRGTCWEVHPVTAIEIIN